MAGAFSSAFSSAFDVGGATVPDAVDDLVATPGTGQITLNWSLPYDGGDALTGFAVYRGTSPGSLSLHIGSEWTLGTDTSIVDDGTYAPAPINGTTYYYAITAWNATGESALSNEVSAIPGVTIFDFIRSHQPRRERRVAIPYHV